MKDFTLYENTIISDFIAIVGKSFHKLRYGINATIRADIKENLTLVRKEMLDWQLLPGTNRTLFSDMTIYPPYQRGVYIGGFKPVDPDPVTPVIQIINSIPDIGEIIDEFNA